MKYGEHLKANISPEYGEDAYLNYSELGAIIRLLAENAPSG
jgi:SPX domain protein involved in polyphosphate accumulation